MAARLYGTGNSDDQSIGCNLWYYAVTIELSNIAKAEYQITRDDYSKLGLRTLDVLVGATINLSKDG